MHTASMSSILRPSSLPLGFRTPSSLSPSLARQIGVSALAGTGTPGTIPALAERAGVSRQTVYELKDRVGERLTGLFEEREQQGSYHMVAVDRARIERVIVGTRCETPSSIRDIMKLFPLYYDLESPCFGFVQGIIAQAEGKALKWMNRLPVHNVKAGVLDEIFNHSEPILEVADLKSQAIVALTPQPGRAEADWSPLLKGLKERGMDPECLISDNGGGINASVKKTFPGKPHRKDGYHVLARLGKEMRRRERVAYKTLGNAYEAEERRAHPKRNDDVRVLAQRAWRARDAADVAIAAYDWFRERYEEVAEALEFVGLTPVELKAVQSCRDKLKAVVARLSVAREKKVQELATYLDKQIDGLTQYMEDLNTRLASLGKTQAEQVAIPAMAALWRLDRMLQSPRYEYAHSRLAGQAMAAIEVLKTLSEERLFTLWPEVMRLIAERYRASSFIECVNSVIRPILTVRKHVSAGAMALFAAWWDLHPRTEGPLKGTCPYTVLTGRVVKDWLAELGFHPSAAVH